MGVEGGADEVNRGVGIDGEPVAEAGEAGVAVVASDVVLAAQVEVADVGLHRIVVALQDVAIAGG